MSNLVIAEQDISIPEVLQRSVVEPAFDDFLLGYDGSYAQTFKGTQELLADEEEDGTAYFIPAIRFLLYTALDLLKQEEVASQLPMEVEDRQSAAKIVLNSIAMAKDIGAVLQGGYEEAEIEAPVDKLEFDNENATYGAADLAKAVFADICLLAGGSLKLLKDKGLAGGEETAAIQRSYGLLRLSRVSDIVLPQIHKNFGQPYIHTKHLRVSSEGGIRVRFTAELLKEFVKRGYINKNTGCPLGRMKAAQTKGNILQEDWREVSGFLVPAGATVDHYKET